MGDIITIELAESTSASKKANTQSGKDNKLTMNTAMLGGVPVTVSPYDLSASLSQNGAFKGQAKADQSNSLQGNISVSVAKVLPNGNLLVRGEKWIMLNNGNEYIRITGMIRPEDVTTDNSVSSQKVANARIHYGGTGDLANTRNRGGSPAFQWPLVAALGGVMKSLRLVALFCCLLPLGMAHASRIKDISSVEGVRSNQLIGYGLVVGLPGTGEKSNAFTEQTFRTMLNNFGIKVPDNIKPKIKDVAPVAIHADLPPFAKPGQTIDVTVSAIGEAKSLRGGTLLQSFLKGLDGRVYAVAQGSLVVGGLGAEGPTAPRW